MKLGAREILVVLASLIVAALVGTLAYSAVSFAIYEFTTSNQFYSTDMMAALYVWVVASVVGVSVALVGGVPGYFLLRWFGLFNLPLVLIVGLALGIVVYLTGISYLPWFDCAAMGAISAFVAWLLLRNSNNSSKRTREPRAA